MLCSCILRIRYSPKSSPASESKDSVLGGILHIVWAVNANWNAGNGWNVNANPVDNPNPWNDENQVLSRNSLRSHASLIVRHVFV